MRHRFIVVAALAGSLLGIGAAPVLADEVTPSPDFGRHLSTWRQNTLRRTAPRSERA